jgi:hypothetical protein
MMLAVTGLPLKIGANGFDAGQRVIATADGGYVVAGMFAGTIKLNSASLGNFNLTSRSDTDLFVAQYNADSSLRWIRQLGGFGGEDGINDQDKSIDIAANPERAGGGFINGVGPQPISAGEYVNDMVVAKDGSIILCGEFLSQIDFDPGHGRAILTNADDDFYDAFVLKLNSGGGFLWVHQISERFTDAASGVAVNSNGDVLVTGLFSRTIDFKPGDLNFRRTASGRADGYLMKLSASSGTPIWVNTFGSEATDANERDAGLDLAVDSADNIYMVGTFVGNVDFDPSPTSSKVLIGIGDTDGFLAKYTTDGRFRYAANVGGEAFDGLTNVAVDSQDSVYVSGYFEGNDFDAELGAGVQRINAAPKDPGDDEPTFTDVFIEKLAGGKVQWIQQLAGSGNEFTSDLGIDSNDNLLVAGAWYGHAKFGTSSQTLTSVAGTDDFDDANDGDRELSYDAFLWRLAGTNGATQYVKPIGSNFDEFGIGLGVASDDSVLLTGRFRGTVDFDTGRGKKNLSAGGFADLFITGFDAGGAPLF